MLRLVHNVNNPNPVLFASKISVSWLRNISAKGYFDIHFRCKRAVCDRCAQNKMIILGYSKSKDPHRVCNICKQESDMLKSFVRTHNITFNQDSVGNEWL